VASTLRRLTSFPTAERLPDCWPSWGTVAMSVRSIMTTKPLTLRADETVGRAVELMLEHRYIVLPVVDANSCHLGEFDVWDLLGLLLTKAATLNRMLPDLKFVADNLPELQAKLDEMRDLPVGDVARLNLPVLRPDTPVTEALLQFYRHRSPLPVVEEESGRLVGILSYWDVIAAVAGQRG
jgi:CBS domain-containing protein